MITPTPKVPYKALISCLILLLISCRHVPIKTMGGVAPSGPASSRLMSRDTRMTFISESKRAPSHVMVQKHDRYSFKNPQMLGAFKKEILINPLMRDLIMTAQVKKNGEILREFVAKKNATSLLSDNKTTWSPSSSKLSLIIPFLLDGEELFITTSYEWMDIRWMKPVLMQEDGPLTKSTLALEVPYGITLHFKTAKDGLGYEFVPLNEPIEKPEWAQENNHGGMGMRYLWQAEEHDQSLSAEESKQLQLYLSFETSTQRENLASFDNWTLVSSYLYDRIDRYDMPSAEIRDFVAQENKRFKSPQEMIARLLSFLSSDIEKRPTLMPLQDQNAQPASRTFARRFGSPLDIAILGKALFQSHGIDADLMAVSHRRFNPNINDFFSPALFHSIILAIHTDHQTIYYDPASPGSGYDQLSPDLQGQHALTIRPKEAELVLLPFASANNNIKTYSYQLFMNDEGLLLGEYAVDLTGFFTQQLSNKMTTSFEGGNNILAVEQELMGGRNTPFSFGTMDISAGQDTHQSLHISGDIKPHLLAKNADEGFLLPMGKLLSFIVRSMVEAKRQNYSSITRVSFFIHMPPGFEAENLPNNINLSTGGINLRLAHSFDSNILTIEGMTYLSLPLQNDHDAIVKPTMDQLESMGSQELILKNSALAKGEQDGDRIPTDAENS